MRDHLRGALLRRQIAYLTAVLSADEQVSPKSERLASWRSEIAAQGYLDGDLNNVFATETTWLEKSGCAPDKLLKELVSQLPAAEQLEDEHRIEVARRATG